MSTQSKEKTISSLKTYSQDSSVCPECGGTGYVIRTMSTPETREIYGDDRELDFACKCPSCNGGYAQKVESVRQNADIPTVFYDKKYESFDWNIYRDNQGRPVDLSQQKKFIDSFLTDFKKWEENGLGLYIWSSMKGSGKTFLASCLCNELMSQHAMRTRFVSATNLLNIAQSGDKGASSEYERDPIKLLCNCKLLVIDDLGQKNSGSDWMNDILFRITDERMQHKLITIITSNIRMSELSLDDRVVDRINKMCQSIPLPDYCVRSKESNEMKLKLFKELGLVEGK